MPKFKFALRFEATYWLDNEALCLNVLTVTDPISFKLTTNNRFGQCSKKVINCLDDWSTWTKSDAKWLDSCRQSSGTDYKLWEYKPITKEEERYFLGDLNFTPNYCWPGPSPLYSPLMQYPDNWILAIKTPPHRLLIYLTINGRQIPTQVPPQRDHFTEDSSACSSTWQRYDKLSRCQPWTDNEELILRLSLKTLKWSTKTKNMNWVYQCFEFNVFDTNRSY